MDRSSISSTTQPQHFVFGYGSLICQKSRALTVPSSIHQTALPAIVHGLERTWTVPVNNFSALGVHFVECAVRSSDKKLTFCDCDCVGVILPVSDQELKKFDERELGYHRKLLDLDRIELYSEGIRMCQSLECQLFLDAKQQDQSDQSLIQIWCYIPDFHIAPTSLTPIAQSYVDIVLRGCLEISEDFCRRWLRSTKGWALSELETLVSCASNGKKHNGVLRSKQMTEEFEGKSYWVNDRFDPLYVRHDYVWSLANAEKIDKILQKYQPDHFRSRIVEDKKICEEQQGSDEVC